MTRSLKGASCNIMSGGIGSIINKYVTDVMNYENAAQVIANTQGLTQAQIAAAQKNLEANFGVSAQQSKTFVDQYTQRIQSLYA